MPFTRKRFAAMLAATASAVLLTSLVVAPTTSGAAARGAHVQKRDRVVQVYVTRHGETLLNKLKRVQGWSDSPLTESGRKTATTVGTNLGKEIGRVDKVYSGDMMRHYETAQLMAQGMHLKKRITKDAALREMNFGGWEGETNARMQAVVFAKLGNGAFTVPQMLQAIVDTNPVPEMPAENCDDINARALPALNGIAKDAARGSGTGKVLVVTSGITIACMLDSMHATIPPTGIANGAVNLLEYKGGTWTVKTVNDTHYAG